MLQNAHVGEKSFPALQDIQMMDLIAAIEEALGDKAIRNYMDNQKRDTPTAPIRGLGVNQVSAVYLDT
jgi:hypothetical protein